jgi:hypothetical protein
VVTGKLIIKLEFRSYCFIDVALIREEKKIFLYNHLVSENEARKVF